MTTLYLSNFPSVETTTVEEILLFTNSDLTLARLKELRTHVEEVKRILQVSAKPSDVRAYLALGADLGAVTDCFESVLRSRIESVRQQPSLPLGTRGRKSTGAKRGKKAVR